MIKKPGKMKVVVVVSANAEWTAVKPLFPNAEIRSSPYGEYFQVVITEYPVIFSMPDGARPRQLARFNMRWIITIRISSLIWGHAEALPELSSAGR